MPVCYLHMWVSMHACLYRSQKTTSGSFLHILFVFQDSVSLWSPDCPRTQYVDQSGLELSEIWLPLPPECWESKVCTMMINYHLIFETRTLNEPRASQFGKTSWSMISNCPPLCPDAHTSTSTGVRAASCYLQHKCQDLHACKVELKTKTPATKGEKNDALSLLNFLSKSNKLIIKNATASEKNSLHAGKPYLCFPYQARWLHLE